LTVVAGVSLFNGVMLIADSRVTACAPGRPDVYCDVAQKIFPLTQTTVLGFSGDVRAASVILRELLKQLRRRHRRDSVSLLCWLPRFMSAIYRAMDKKKQARRVDFIVGSVIPNRVNIVERQKIVDILTTIASGNASIQRNGIPDILMRVIQQSPSEAAAVAIPGTVHGVLYTMSPPQFRPIHVNPLEFCAIGSGHGTTVEIKRSADWIIYGRPGNDFRESIALREAVSQFIASNRVESVGGLYPCVKIDQRGVGFLGMLQGLPLYVISLSYDAQRMRWIQENQSTGKKIELQYPWEIDPVTMKSDNRFDDWREAVERFNPLRARKKVASGSN
jgi:hypothetical protein